MNVDLAEAEDEAMVAAELLNQVPLEEGGWLDMPRIIRGSLPYTWIWGGRGIGKTYGALKFLRERALKHGEQFILVRRTQTQLDIMSKPFCSPWQQLDEDCQTLTCQVPQRYMTAYYSGYMDGDKMLPEGSPLGYGMALSTMHNVRGINMTHIAYMLYDEYIPEAHERPIKNELEALLNMVETIGRNRELKGLPPMKVIALSNANRVDNPYFAGLGLIDTIERMELDGVDVVHLQSRDTTLIRVRESPISEAKAWTSLYRMSATTEFGRMALDNQFGDLTRDKVRKVPIRECVPVCTISNVCIYRHKSRRMYYATTHVSGSPIAYRTTPEELKRWHKEHIDIYKAYIEGNLLYDKASTGVTMRRLLTGK